MILIDDSLTVETTLQCLLKFLFFFSTLPPMSTGFPVRTVHFHFSNFAGDNSLLLCEPVTKTPCAGKFAHFLTRQPHRAKLTGSMHFPFLPSNNLSSPREVLCTVSCARACVCGCVCVTQNVAWKRHTWEATEKTFLRTAWKLLICLRCFFCSFPPAATTRAQAGWWSSLEQGDSSPQEDNS